MTLGPGAMCLDRSIVGSIFVLVFNQGGARPDLVNVCVECRMAEGSPLIGWFDVVLVAWMSVLNGWGLFRRHAGEAWGTCGRFGHGRYLALGPLWPSIHAQPVEIGIKR